MTGTEPSAPPIHGTTSPGFHAVHAAFASHFSARLDVGASVAVVRDGETLVDLWGGVADAATGRTWSRRTVAPVFSATKGAAACVVHLLVDRRVLDLDAPVARYWPEFADRGKAAITVRDLMAHRAGLPVLETPIARDQLDARAAAALATQRPRWTPDDGHGYHGLTVGWLVDEVVRRVTGAGLATVFDDEIARPLGLDFSIGLPDDPIDRALLVNGRGSVPPPSAPPPPALLVEALTVAGALPAPEASAWNSPDVLRLRQPAVSGLTNARSLARLYAACVSSSRRTRLLSGQAIDEARREHSRGIDLVTGTFSRFGAGFQLPHPRGPMLSAGCLGHYGAGGAVGFADPELHLGFAYVPNAMGALADADPRATALIDAAREDLALTGDGRPRR